MACDDVFLIVWAAGATVSFPVSSRWLVRRFTSFSSLDNADRAIIMMLTLIATIAWPVVLVGWLFVLGGHILIKLWEE